jgi:uncharacterized heparinase superfamily protein
LISKYFHTIRHLKLKQLYYKVWYNFTKPFISNYSPIIVLRTLENKFFSPIQKKKSLLNENSFKFLNKSYSLSEIGWKDNNNAITKLWRYNQHYFDDLNAVDSLKRKSWHDQLLNHWIRENSLGKGIGWDPYPISIRIVNWIKWHLQGNKLSDALLKSLALQTSWLNKRIEWHILGNHLFSNAKALIFAGLFFSSKQSEIWLKKGLKIIDDELKEQVLNDGGHFELSPMYHAIFLEDLLDLINIAQTYPEVIQKSHINEWKQVTKKMFMWLDSMTHPDGDIAFFNDTALGIAPNLNNLKLYADRLKVNYRFIKFNKIINLSDSGYIRMTSKDAVVLLDTAPIGPDYLPGHAHADTLSFELSLFGQRVFVNGGTSEYGNNSIRQYERSTEAHNTVVVNNKNSSEVWGSFRVARRAKPFNLQIRKFNNESFVSCAHDGYKHLRGKPIHERSWKLSKSSLIIKDYVKGFYKNAFAYIHLHPLVKIHKINKNNWNLKIKNSLPVLIDVKGVSLKLEKFYYATEFGKKIKSQRFKIEIDNKGSCVAISWKN